VARAQPRQTRASREAFHPWKALQELVELMALHLDLEKQMVLPVIRERVAHGPTIADRLRDEHQPIEHILIALDRWKANSPDVPDMVTEMLHFADRRVAESEALVLPGLRSALSVEQLEEVDQRMNSDERRVLTTRIRCCPLAV
jgi:hypothetical protein